MELRHARHIERNVREIGGFAAQQCNDTVKRAPDAGWGRRLARVRKAARQACPGFEVAVLRQLQGRQAAPSPGDAAAADRRVEKRVCVCRHGRQS
jgi:hypothetical protein